MGVQVGDTLLTANGKPLSTVNLKETLTEIGIGNAIKITVRRGAKTLTLEGTVGFQFGQASLSLAPEAELTPERKAVRESLLRMNGKGTK
jgi:hypothetical protein